MGKTCIFATSNACPRTFWAEAAGRMCHDKHKTMLKKLLHTALLWAAILPAVAQSYGVSGRVCEEAEGHAPCRWPKWNC